MRSDRCDLSPTAVFFVCSYYIQHAKEVEVTEVCDLLTIDFIYLKKQSDGLGCTVSLLLTKVTEIECDQSLTGQVGSNRNSPSINPVTKKSLWGLAYVSSSNLYNRFQFSQGTLFGPYPFAHSW